MEMDIRPLIKFLRGITYPVMDICGHTVLFSEDGFAAVNGQIGHCRVYWLRGGYDDDPGWIAAIEDRPVYVNQCGMILTDEDLGIPKDGPTAGYLNVTPGDWGYIGEEWTINDYLLRRENFGNGPVEEDETSDGRKSGRYKWGD